MKTINDILNFFEEFAPCATQMSFDNAGLIVGDKCTAVSRVLVALDITEDVVNEAESLGCELIISHHPVIFAPIKRLSPSSVPYLLAQKGISAVCMHTNLDLGEKVRSKHLPCRRTRSQKPRAFGTWRVYVHGRA